MSYETISGVASSTATYETTKKERTNNTKSTTTSTTDKNTETSSNSSTNEKAAVYEKSSTSKTTASAYTSSGTKTKNEAIVAQLKADLETRTNQLQDIVSQMLQKQGTTLAKADDIWSFLANGNFGNVSEAAKAQAQADIAEDGYWGVEQTSERILSFAKALAGDDPSQADAMLAAFKKGYEQATKAWGKKLPDISSRTYDAVVQKFDAWKNGTSTETAASDE